ncbi:rhomboid family intramembrane serine protease [Haloarcula salinisoli]|uniref:Rhomboid family intramembrane serine protease n=1 Tax=Haloarcula salinisoli TaxID=2487746 RepID=A0A8J7YJY2_9EURY|nr:rhomboid family intramembrane serine protease [Halomicroarcula salinisoli]MBX0302588.1 rhomboid family intramembrane serine protease [Halomicroarcula salinisoli]
MSECDVCGKQENMPYQCGHCGGTYCAEHRLPEAHDCPGLDNWNDPKGVFDSGFDDSVDGGSSGGSGGVADRFGVNTGPGGPLAYFRGNMTYVFLATMAIVFVLQHVVLLTLGVRAHQFLFVIHPQNPEYVWTWVTSIFSHAPFSLSHIALNGLVIYFFGRLAERQMGSKKFTLFFIGSGVLAGLGQIGIQMLQGGTTGALGASGAALAILGFVTVLNPDLTVYLYFLLPVPIWAITGFYAIISIAGVLAPGAGILGGNVGHAAHLAGLVIGLWYGKRIKDRTRIPNQIQFGGRRGGGGPGGPGGPGGRGPF